MSERRSIIVTVENRFVRGDGSTVPITDSVEEPKPPIEFKTTPAVVRRAFGVTLNMGNFESTRVDVSVEVPCYLEDVERADEFARDFCEQRLKAEVTQLKPPKDKNPL